MNSKQKGKRGELEWAKWLRDNLKVQAIRGVQYCGASNSPDVVGLVSTHFECKRVEALNIDKAMEQASRDCGPNVPVVVHRKNRGEWLVTVKAKDWKRISHIVYGVTECKILKEKDSGDLLQKDLVTPSVDDIIGK